VLGQRAEESGWVAVFWCVGLVRFCCGLSGVLVFRIVVLFLGSIVWGFFWGLACGCFASCFVAAVVVFVLPLLVGIAAVE